MEECIREPSLSEEKSFSFTADFYRVEKAALRLIARAEQNSQGLTAKLLRRSFDADVVKDVVSSLLERHLVDDTRYAELWIRSRLSNHKAQSPLGLLAALEKRGINRDSSRKILNKVLDHETEYALLSTYMNNKRFPENKKPISLRAHLKYEGFSIETLDRYFNS